MVDLCLVVKWSSIPMVVWKPDWINLVQNVVYIWHFANENTLVKEKTVKVVKLSESQPRHPDYLDRNFIQSLSSFLCKKNCCFHFQTEWVWRMDYFLFCRPNVDFPEETNTDLLPSDGKKKNQGTLEIWILDRSGIQMVESCPIVKWFDIRTTAWIPDI